MQRCLGTLLKNPELAIKKLKQEVSTNNVKGTLEDKRFIELDILMLCHLFF